MSNITPEMRRANRLTLAEFLENNITDAQFDMESWTGVTACGTTGCALGWAAMAEVVEGLGYSESQHAPVLCGEVRGWREVGEEVFGVEAFAEVFVSQRFTEWYATDDENAQPPTRYEVAQALRDI